ncbi:unnamed protein product [Rangifer tarandus platyrhynchus]|uniref:Uncharacterized protein n=1 Tax=Rangifer tarandus platyrhynchus TaxID=3082113 RepID=A0ABN8XJZ8_RANTA|nr:unnamed protein product [Rangifer tarandus platyrhynchus]
MCSTSLRVTGKCHRPLLQAAGAPDAPLAPEEAEGTLHTVVGIEALLRVPGGRVTIRAKGALRRRAALLDDAEHASTGKQCESAIRNPAPADVCNAVSRHVGARRTLRPNPHCKRGRRPKKDITHNFTILLSVPTVQPSFTLRLLVKIQWSAWRCAPAGRGRNRVAGGATSGLTVRRAAERQYEHISP